ncbi:hypothetical protein OTK49_02155 [Vibrio coralliirubri]|uniref:hypothetical protein n=1 Tax=Vibrio coralliirubri TaxID=1516159 RepID=UPI0022849A91|nr:hypothetical protein [Vibrio coralliirubri]MCY9861318.1 hypothetical protein [Vibrio coralliirubri]
MKTNTRKKDEKLEGFVVNDFCGQFTEQQFNDLLSLSSSKADSKTSLAVKDFFVGGINAYHVHQQHALNYSVVNRAIWNLVKRHVNSIEYCEKHGSEIRPASQSPKQVQDNGVEQRIH